MTQTLGFLPGDALQLYFFFFYGWVWGILLSSLLLTSDVQAQLDPDQLIDLAIAKHFMSFLWKKKSFGLLLKYALSHCPSAL